MDTRDQIQNEGNEVLHEHHRMARIKRYIAGNLATDLSIVAVAQKFELSISSLLHVFKKHQQQSYQRYVEETRMNKAMELIKEGKWTKEVMNATGYRYRGTFNMAFKRKFKHPPSYFRK